jgi:hypothetical protein
MVNYNLKLKERNIMVQDYYSLIKSIRAMRRDYPNLTIEQKNLLMNMELKIEAKYIKPNECHTKSEKKKLKQKINEIRRHNAKNHIENK